MNALSTWRLQIACAASGACHDPDVGVMRSPRSRVKSARNTCHAARRSTGLRAGKPRWRLQGCTAERTSRWLLQCILLTLALVAALATSGPSTATAAADGTTRPAATESATIQPTSRATTTFTALATLTTASAAFTEAAAASATAKTTCSSSTAAIPAIATITAKTTVAATATATAFAEATA